MNPSTKRNKEDEIHMSSNTENDLFQFNKKDLKEIYYIIVVAILFFIFEFKFKRYFNDEKKLLNAEFYTALLLFGLLHILASNILTYLYNLRTVMMPFLKPPIISITPRKLKILGGALMIASILGWTKMISK